LVWWAVLPAGAQAAVDPQAREYAFALYGVYQQSSYSGDWNPFFQACSRDPVMTRKSFISTLLYAAEQVNTSPVDAQNAILFANALAQTLGQIGDPAPSAIMQAIAAGYPQDQLLQMVSAYATPLYPQFTAVQPGVSPSTTPATAPKEYDPATFKYGDNPERVSQLPPAVWALLKPIYTKIARIDMAISFSNPELSIQELDGFAQVAKSARATAMGMGAVDNAASRATFAEFVAVADAPKLVILTELGLHSEFDTRLEATLANEKDTNKHAGLLLAGAGQALQRGDKARARQLMARIRPIVGNSYVPPALEYGMRTTEYRIARLEGPAPTLAQVSREFEKAWAAVEKFRPFLIVADDQ
jgi:hypothetical protein